MPVSYYLRNKELDNLGFNTYRDYLESPLWKIIREEVYKRDGYRCRARYCTSKHRVIEAHHLSYSRATLLGLGTYALISLCPEHHRQVEFNEEGKAWPKEVLKRTLTLVVGSREKGKSSPRVGFWFASQHLSNRPIAIKVFKRLKLEAFEWYVTIIKDLKAGRLPYTYQRLLAGRY